MLTLAEIRELVRDNPDDPELFGSRNMKVALDEIDRLAKWQIEMVEKAAAKSLDGYRELGARCAALEEERDKANARLAQWKHALGALYDYAFGDRCASEIQVKNEAKELLGF